MKNKYISECMQEGEAAEQVGQAAVYSFSNKRSSWSSCWRSFANAIAVCMAWAENSQNLRVRVWNLLNHVKL